MRRTCRTILFLIALSGIVGTGTVSWVRTRIVHAAAQTGRPAPRNPGSLQTPRAGTRRVPPQDRPVQVAQRSPFEIPADKDEVALSLETQGAGLYSAELSFRCDDPVRKHDRISMTVGTSPTGAGRTNWYGNAKALNPDASYRFFFWVDQAKIAGAAGTIRVVLGRVDRQRSREEGEFESRHRVSIALPKLVGSIHFRTPTPIAVQAISGAAPAPHPVSSGSLEILQYRVSATFPRPTPRMGPLEVKTEFRVQREGRTENVGGVLIRNGRWLSAQTVKESGAFDFVASALTEFAKDRYGRRRIPTEEDWLKFKSEGLLVELDSRRTPSAAALFYIAGGDLPADYYVVELEEIRLSTVPDEGEGTFWLKLNSGAAVTNPAAGRPSTDPFGRPSSSESTVAQTLETRIAVPPSGEMKGTVRPRLPLLVLPYSAMQSQRKLRVGADPHYYHEMLTLEQGEYVMTETGGSTFLEGIISQNPEKIGEGIVTFLTKVGKARNPDTYRSFGMDAFETDNARGWALQNQSMQFSVEGQASGAAAYKEAYAGSNTSVATLSALSPGAQGRWHGSTLQVRRVPGVNVEGARIRILNVKTNRKFNGYIHVYIGIAGHGGGRSRTSGSGLKMETSAVGSPWSYWVYTVTERGPFDLRPGGAQAIDFTSIDFSNPDRNPEGLWEQLSHTFGPWAALHIQVKLDKTKGKTTNPVDVGYFTIYPYDYVYGELRGSSRRDGEWIILNGTLPVRSYILDEVGLEVRLRIGGTS